MSLYTDIQAEVFLWTNRSDLVAETDAAIKSAVRTAHCAGLFFRDMVQLNLTGQDTSATVQQIDLSSVAPNCRGIVTVKPTNADLEYSGVQVTDLFDRDGYSRTNVYWGLGTYLMIRPAAPSPDISIVYTKAPTVTPVTAIDSWIASMYSDLISLLAAASVLAVVGEQEVKTRVENLAGIVMRELIADNLAITEH